MESQFPQAECPEADFVRFVDREEWAEVIAARWVEQVVDTRYPVDPALTVASPAITKP